MINNDPFIVSLYLHGKDLNPNHVSNCLSVLPIRSHYKGQKIITSTGRELVKKAGVWVLSASTKSDILSDHIKELAAKLKVDGKFIKNIAGVEDAYIDVFMCTIRDKGGSDSSYFELSLEDIHTLAQLSFRVQFTVGSTEE